jgi:hypothetical protein
VLGNAAVRKLAIPDLTTTVQTNDHWHRRGLFAREGQQPEIGERASVDCRNVFGCGGCNCDTLFDLSGVVACDRNLYRVLCSVDSVCAHVR